MKEKTNICHVRRLYVCGDPHYGGGYMNQRLCAYFKAREHDGRCMYGDECGDYLECMNEEAQKEASNE